MASEILRPNADGDDVAWTATGVANDWECVSESSPDENTTYLVVAAGTAATTDELVNLAASAIGGSDTINSVTLTLRALHSATQPAANFLWKENGVKTVGGAISLTTSYADYTEVRSVRPSDGAAWTLADLNALQIGMRRVGNAGTGAVRLTQAFVTIDYTPAVAGGHRRLSLLGVG